jgi:hypothetical protein
VPAVRWRPWKVPHVLLGDQRAPCAGSRARTCPVPGHPCLDGVAVAEVVAAVERLVPARRTGAPLWGSPDPCRSTGAPLRGSPDPSGPRAEVVA